MRYENFSERSESKQTPRLLALALCGGEREALEIDILPQSGKRLGNIASFGRVRSRHVVTRSTFREHLPRRSPRVAKESVMPPAVKKRKTVAGAKRKPTVPAIQPGIQVFGRITKSQVQISGKSTLEKAGLTNTDGKSTALIATGKKRKFESVEGASEAEECQNLCSTEAEAAQIDKSDSIQPHAGHTPVQESLPKSPNPVAPRLKQPRQSDTETPTKGARSLLQGLELPSSPSTPPSSPSFTNYDTPQSSPTAADEACSNPDAPDGLPDELQDLIDLHSSFLTALSLHFAHNGPTIPADLRNLTPGIERVWRRRRVSTDDIQRLLAFEQGKCLKGKEKSGALHLSDYGHGKICIELADLPQSRNVQRQPINENKLNASFIQNLEQQWSSYRTTHRHDATPSNFISSLPRIEIPPCASLSKIAPLLSKGQRRLEDLKAGAIKAQQNPQKSRTANATSTSQQREQKTTARSIDLFSRLKAKQLHQSTLPLPPSSDTLAKKSALQRLPEIAPVLESLAVSSKKHCNDDAGAETARSRVTHVSFTMPTLVQHLQMSLRNPIGKEEAVRCVILLGEVTPEWVGVREVGKLTGVTVRGSGVGRDELGRRIKVSIDRL